MNFLLFIDTYRNSYIESATNSRIGWDNGTIYFYFSIIAIILLLGWLVERKKKSVFYNRELKPYFTIAGVVLSFVLGLRGVGVGKDTVNYVQSLSESRNYVWDGEGLEPGFMFVNKILGLFFSDGHISVFIFSAITIYLILSSLWKYKNIINIFFAFGFFVGVYYFQALNLLRLYLATSMVTWGFHFVLTAKIKKYVICVLVAAAFHMSALVMLLPLIYYAIYKKSPWIAFASLCAGVVAVVTVASHFSDYLAYQRYAAYGDVNEFEGGFGIMLLIDYLPGLVLIWYIWKHKLTGIWADMLICFTMVAVFIRSIGYYIIIAGRLGAYFMILYLILIPYFLNEMKVNRRKEYFPFVCFLFVFLLFKIHMYFVGYLASDGIMPYYFLWNE